MAEGGEGNIPTDNKRPIRRFFREWLEDLRGLPDLLLGSLTSDSSTEKPVRKSNRVGYRRKINNPNVDPSGNGPVLMTKEEFHKWRDKERLGRVRQEIQEKNNKDAGQTEAPK